MRKDWKYILYVGGAIILFVVVRMLAPKQFDWNVTLAHDDKNPFGAYALNELLPDIFKSTDHHYKTAYEFADSLNASDNIFILATGFSGDKPDTEALMRHVERGGNVFISANYFWGVFADTLKLTTHDYFFRDPTPERRDSSYLQFTNTSLDTTRQFWFSRDNIHNYFDKFDTLKATVIAKNHLGDPVTIRVRQGKGNFFLNSTPLIFTNIYLLSRDNHEFAATMLSFLPSEQVTWTEFYQVGRRESSSPLRFILNSEPLAWAYYICLTTLLIFMVFEAKRKQRIIPVINPLANTSLQFVSTIGNLYYQKGDHKNIAEKKIIYLLEVIRSKYYLKTNKFDLEFYDALASKSGKPLEEVRELFRLIIFISSSTMISDTQLMELNQRIEKFIG